MMQTLVSFGDAIKADDSGRVRGYLVRFGGADLEGDYFTASTDFGRPMKSGDRVAMNLYYHHGQDRTVGKSRIGTGYITMDDKGLWYEAQVEMADQYQKMIQELAKSGKLGYSSGATGHMVERKKMSDGRYEITRWPIGEASLTPTPAEPMNAVKSLKDMYGDMEGDTMDEMAMPPMPQQSPEEYAAELYKVAESDLVHEGLESYYDAMCAGISMVADAAMADAIIDEFANRAKQLYAMHGAKSFKAAPGDLKVGDNVRWRSSGGTATGRIQAISTDGALTPEPNGDPQTGTADNPVYKIRIYTENSEGETVFADTRVVHRAAALTKIPDPTKESPASLRGVERRLRDAVGLSRTSAKRLAPVVWDTLRDADQTPQQPELVVPEVKASTDQDARQDMLARLELLAQL
jgi:phage head maturation protease